MNILMGIGNAQRADDGIGVYIAKKVNQPNWMVLDCGTVPENFTSLIKKNKPEWLVLVDAAQMDIAPAQMRSIPKEKIEDVGVGTHALPLSVIMTIMEPYVQHKMLFIGFQPKHMGDGEVITDELLAAADQFITLLESNKLNQIPELD